MPIPKELVNTLLPAEAEFLAESELITISPLQRLPMIQLITGSFGPFKPPRKCEVPLWLAITLKSRGKCIIEPPSWLNIANISAKIEHEKTHSEFSSLPYHYIEIAHILLDCAADDIPDANKLRILFKDFRDIRLPKSRLGLKNLDPHYLQMDNLGSMEINEIRPYFTRTFNELRRFQPVEDEQQPEDGADDYLDDENVDIDIDSNNMDTKSNIDKSDMAFDNLYDI